MRVRVGLRHANVAGRMVQSFPIQDLVEIHGAASCSQRDDDPRVDGLYALIASTTNIESHPQAHLAQRFAVDLFEQKYEQSMSQIAQDRFVLFALGERRSKGYFVEFGATDGCELSNTYLLERDFGWSGIVAEPNPAYQAALRRNRRCSISDECVWSRSGETLPFKVVDSYPPLSTIAEYQNADQHDRSQATTIEVPTISLNDLLQRHGAPRQIDYISIDTEGSELAILEAFDFSAYDVSIFTIEHNFTSRARENSTIDAAARIRASVAGVLALGRLVCPRRSRGAANASTIGGRSSLRMPHGGRVIR